MSVTNLAQAAAFRVEFRGVVTNSRDSGGAFFGAAAEGGQNGLAISGAFVFDDAAYPDQNGTPFFGVYGPVGGFPQTENRIASSYTVSSRAITPGQWFGVPSGHSIESAAMQDIPRVNTVPQDIVGHNDGSQSLLCADPQDATTCSGGALATDSLQIQLFGITDFVGSDALAQPLDLDEAEIRAIVAGRAGGQRKTYAGLRYDSNNITSLVYDFAGEFRLTALRGAPVTVRPPVGVPEPASSGLLALGVASLVLLRRRRRG